MRLQQEERNVITAVNDWLMRALLVVFWRRAGASVVENVIVEAGDATPR